MESNFKLNSFYHSFQIKFLILRKCLQMLRNRMRMNDEWNDLRNLIQAHWWEIDERLMRGVWEVYEDGIRTLWRLYQNCMSIVSETHQSYIRLISALITAIPTLYPRCIRSILYCITFSLNNSVPFNAIRYVFLCGCTNHFKMLHVRTCAQANIQACRHVSRFETQTHAFKVKTRIILNRQWCFHEMFMHSQFMLMHSQCIFMHLVSRQ